jgi:hypothetical protein
MFRDTELRFDTMVALAQVLRGYEEERGIFP